MSRGGRFARDSADNEEGKREDRFVNLIRGWREKLSGREHTYTRARARTYAYTGVVERRRTIRSSSREACGGGAAARGDEERDGGGECEKERRRWRSVSSGESGDEIVCMHHSIPADQFSCRYPEESDTVLAEYFKGRYLLPYEPVLIPRSRSRVLRPLELIRLSGILVDSLKLKQ
jgi:hypothetical protein